MWLVAVQTRRVHQAHDGRSPLTSAQAAGEQPVLSAERDRSDLVLHPVVVGGQIRVVDVARECQPALQALVDGLSGRRALGHLLPLRSEPLMQRIGHFA